MAAARGVDIILPTTATSAVALVARRHEGSFGGFWLSPTPPTRFGGRSSRVARGARTEHRASNRFSTAIQQYSLAPTASRTSTETLKSTRRTIRGRPEESSRLQVESKRAVSTDGIQLHEV